MLNRLLYACPVGIKSSCGVSSSVRIIIASVPPIRKNVKAVTMYWTPIILWSTFQRRNSLSAGRFTCVPVLCPNGTEMVAIVKTPFRVVLTTDYIYLPDFSDNRESHLHRPACHHRQIPDR